ncbi:MAG TPA: cytochrome c [Candidatus Angelobacter sp.]|nr:cytochrome c [Candidatus Angelobacter sp.]
MKIPGGLVLCFFLAALPLLAQTGIHLDTGEHIYHSACMACHGADGTGTPQVIAGFERPGTFPDFTRCDQTAAEPNTAWKDVIIHGGPARGFSQIMPSFSEALTAEQIDKVVEYMRGFCKNSHWPRGELNLPLPLNTEKAFPEDEVVLRTEFNASGAPGVTTHVVHEQRFGVKNQIEVDVPITFQDQNHVWHGGVGDSVLGLKRVLFSNLHSGSILSLQGEVIFPVGNRDKGLGSGVTTFGMFAAFGQLFPTNTFIQFQGGANLPTDTRTAPQSIFWNTAVGQSIVANKGLGRMWSPMVEFLAARDLTTGAKTNWDVVPQMQVTISRRQHIRGNIGFRTPANNTAGRQKQLMFYLLWDRADGSLLEGW